MSQASLTLLVLALMAISFLAQKIPPYLTALIGALALGLLGVLPLGTLFSGFANPTLILFAGMFVIGESMFYTGMANALGEWTVRRMGRGERRLLWGTMIAAGALSTVASNTGTTAALMPVVLSLCLAAGIPVSRQLMPMAFATGFGGFSALIGTPPNMIVSEALREAGLRPFGFFEFAWVGIPLALGGMLYMDLVGRRLLPVSRPAGPAPNAEPELAEAGTRIPEAAVQAPRIAAAAGRSRARMWACALILLGVIVVMALDIRGLPLEIVAVAGAIACVLTGCIGGREAIRSIEWETMILFGSMFAVAQAMEKSGASSWLAGGLLQAWGPESNPYLILGGLIGLTMLLGSFLSNTACAVIMTPIGLALAKGIGANPHALMMAIAVAASCSFLTPLGTPPNLLVWEAGGYRFLDYLKVGGGLSLVCLVIGIIAIPLVWPVFPP